MAEESSIIKVFLLDDHDIVRAGVTELINAEEDLEVVGGYGRAEGAAAAILKAAPDVAVVDVRLGDGTGIEVCREVRSQDESIACLVLTSFADDHAIVDASMAGAAGYVLKQVQSNDLLESIRKVAGGAVLLDAAEVRMALERLNNSDEGLVATLTPQEHKIFELIGRGFSNRQIADELFLAEKTVKNYVSNVLAKMGMARRTEAAATAARIDERDRIRRS